MSAEANLPCSKSLHQFSLNFHCFDPQSLIVDESLQFNCYFLVARVQPLHGVTDNDKLEIMLGGE